MILIGIKNGLLKKPFVFIGSDVHTEVYMAAGLVYTTANGDVEVVFTAHGFHGTDRMPCVNPGWWERPDGTRVQIYYRNGKWDTESCAPSKK